MKVMLRMQVLSLAMRRQFSSFVSPVGLFLALLLLPCLAFAAPKVSDEPLAADDIVSVTVLGHPEMSVAQTTVSSNGKIQVPVAGSVAVSGKSLNQAAAAVARALRKELRDPQVTVGLVQARPRRVFVLGAVAKPGVYETKPGWRITEVLAAAGGLTARAELIDAVLTRARTQPIRVELEKLIANGNQAANLVLRPDDVLRLTPRTVPISVAGQVERPGNYDLPVGNGIIEALALAGGPTQRAAKTQVTIKRMDGKVIPVDVIKALEPGQAALNTQLQAGDLIMVPESRSRVTVRGAVTKPGYVEIPDGSALFVTEAVALAGGPATNAALSKATITRGDGKVVPVDLFKALVRGETNSNLRLSSDDVVTIPESRARVTISGAVLKPGQYDIMDGETLRLSEAVALAGGAAENAALSKAIITHENGTSVPVNLYKILVQGSAEGNVNIDAGDVVTIPAAQGITVVGAVNRPGKYNVQEGVAPLTQVLALAGGLSIQPEVARISLSRPGENGRATIINVNATQLISLRDQSQNAIVQDGDLVSVSALESQVVFVVGEVNRPGSYELKEGDSVPELLARAGGATTQAALTRISVKSRDGAARNVNVLPVLLEGKPNEDGPLREGDFVVVPQNTAGVLILGAVNKPGKYTIPENQPLTLGEALGLAGGAKDRAKVKQIAILTQNGAAPAPGTAFNPETMNRQIVSVDGADKGLLALNKTLVAGTVVYVPEGKQSLNTWQKLTSSLSSLAALGVAFF